MGENCTRGKDARCRFYDERWYRIASIRGNGQGVMNYARTSPRYWERSGVGTGCNELDPYISQVRRAFVVVDRV